MSSKRRVTDATLSYACMSVSLASPMESLRSHEFPTFLPPSPTLHVAQNCTLPYNHPLLRPILRSATPAISMSLPSPEDTVRALVGAITPDLSTHIQRIEPVSSVRIQQLYLLHLDDRRPPLLLSLPPTSDIRPLRSERHGVASEVLLLAWLHSLHTSVTRGALPIDESGPSARPTLPQHENLSRPSLQEDPGYLIQHIPRIIYPHLPYPNDTSLDISIVEPTVGIISTDKLGDNEKNSVYRQVGQLFRRISSYTSPSGKFGYAVDILEHTLHSDEGISMPESRMLDKGFRTWSEAFHLLLESVLRDLEDLQVQVAYSRVRSHFVRVAHVLDRVKRPSLVLLNTCEMANITICSFKGECPSSHSISVSGYWMGEDMGDEHGNVRVTGLRDWSDCIFGDPLLATIFAENSPGAFMDGLHMQIDDSDPFISIPLIEDQENSHIRLALYKCYHALCGIAREYHHPRDAGMDKELQWRKVLQDCLEYMSYLQDGAA